MNLSEFKEIVKSYKNYENSISMEKYMKNNFLFLGIKAPIRREIEKEYFSILRTNKSIDFNIVNDLWNEEFREFQYIATDYLNIMKKHLVFEDLYKLKLIIVQKSWWDSVDNFPRLVGEISKNDKRVDEEMISWSKDENIWIRRVAILYQLGKKENTNTNVLQEIIFNNLGSNEFFINKAIGWALREYSKTNPEYVREILRINGEKLAPLTIREASKYI